MELEARQNRYQLIEKVCREKHVNTILVAHHADDQVETFLMRYSSSFYLTAVGSIETAASMA